MVNFDDKEKKLEEGPMPFLEKAKEIFESLKQEKTYHIEMDLTIRQLQKLTAFLPELDYICPDCPTDRPYLGDKK